MGDRERKKRDAEYQRRRYKDKISQRVCVRCGNPAWRSRCEECRVKRLDRDAAYAKRQRLNRVERGLCIRCGNLLIAGIDGNNKKCTNCSQRVATLNLGGANGVSYSRFT